LVLNSSRSGYRTIIKNLVENSLRNKSFKYQNIFVFQKNGWESLELDYLINKNNKSTKIIIIDSFRSKWIRGIFEQFLINFYAIYFRCDLIFMPCTFGLLIPIKKVITFVHTNTSFQLPANFRGRGYFQQLAHNLMVKVTFLTSTKLLFTTNITKKEYMNFNGANHSSKLSVIGNGIKVQRFLSGEIVPVKILERHQFFLSISQIYKLKNFDSLIKGYLRYVNNFPEKKNIKLVIVGTIQEKNYFEELINLSKTNENIIFLQNLSDEQLNWLYKNCDTYVFLSYFEGFSLTPAEAICSGKNVILSDINVHREVYKNLANYVNPYSIDSIYKGFLNKDKFKLSENLRKTFIDKISIEKFIERLYKEFQNV